MDTRPTFLHSNEAVEFYVPAESIQEFQTENLDDAVKEITEDKNEGIIFTNTRVIFVEENKLTDVLYDEIGSFSITHKEKNVSVKTGLKYFITSFAIAIPSILGLSLFDVSFMNLPQYYLYIPFIVIAALFFGLGLYQFLQDNTIIPERYQLQFNSAHIDTTTVTIETNNDLNTILFPLLRKQKLNLENPKAENSSDLNEK